MSLPPTRESQALLPASLREALRLRVDGRIGLPLLSDTASQVLVACQDPRSDLQELADLVQHDQSLAAHILRVANSVAYAPREPILSLQQAIGRLGLSTVSDVAIAAALKENVFDVPGYQERLRELWRHSAVAACWAKEIAGLQGRNLESAFLCGLLHDVGMPITLQAVCDLVKKGAFEPVTPEVMEAAMAEFHCEFGARIAQGWRLGPWISSAALHHGAPAGARFLREEVLVTALADALAYWSCDETRSAADFVDEQGLVDELGLGADPMQVLLARRGRVLESAAAYL